MGIRKMMGKHRRDVRKKERDAIKATDLYKEVDYLRGDIDAFWGKNPLVTGDLAASVAKLRKEADDEDARLNKRGEEIIEELRQKVFNDYEAKKLLNYINHLRKEHELLKKSDLWPKTSKK